METGEFAGNFDLDPCRWKRRIRVQNRRLFYDKTKKVAKIAMTCAVILAVIAGAYFGWLAFNRFFDKPLAVHPYASTPEASGPEMANFWPVTKSKKIYQYEFYGDTPSGFSSEKYLAKHPKDAIMVSSSSSGESTVLVYSDNLPDPNFFPKYEMRERRSTEFATIN